MLKPNSKDVILVVEDDYSNFLFIKILLQDIFVVEWAIDGEKAVALFKKGNYKLILMDYKMPKMSGVEATILIRQLNKTIPIIAQTGYDVNEIDLLNAGCNYVLIKPIRRSSLLNTIQQFLPEMIKS